MSQNPKVPLKRLIINSKPKIAVSVGDLNGVGAQIAITCHNELIKEFDIVYCVNKNAFLQALNLLDIALPINFIIYNVGRDFNVKPGQVSKRSALASFEAFTAACDLAENKEVDAIITLPIHKKAWNLAGINYAGHTEYLRERYKTNAIMALGCDKMMVGLYTDHIALKEVFKKLKLKPLTKFLIDLAKYFKADKIAVLGVNPHAGDDGVLGSEDEIIKKAIKKANARKSIFDGPFPPDTAFTPQMRRKYKFFAAMTHDHGLIALKALYFDESINVSFGLPIIRVSVDHGTAFDIAYKKNPSTKSYMQAFKYVKGIIHI